MYNVDQTITEAILHCRSCGAGLCVESKFCRYCGAAQGLPGTNVQEPTVPIDNPCNDTRDRYVTTRMTKPRIYHPVSGPLVKAVIAGVPATTQHSRLTSWPKRMLPALMAIPIWVMIILLSPIDAYTSARIIGNRI
jgi:hypothetical protein